MLRFYGVALFLASALPAAQPEPPPAAETLFVAGKFEEALALFRREATRKPRDPLPPFNVGAAQMRLGRLGEAIASFSQSLALLDTGNWGRYRNGRDREAEDSLARFRGRLLFNRARAY